MSDDLAAWIVDQIDREIAAAVARIEGLERARAIAQAIAADQADASASTRQETQSEI